MLRVRVENFQSIEDQTIEVSGLTVLTGKSNIGKSAVIRAIRGLLSNTTGSAFVRHGVACPRVTKNAKACKCFCRVTLDLKDHTVVWEKGEGTNRYTVDGVLYDKAERGYPPFLAPLLLDPIKMGSDEVLVQVSDQWNPLFIFGRSASEVAEVLGDVGDLPKVQLAIKAAEKDRKDTVATLKIRSQDLEVAEKNLQDLSYVPDLVQSFESLEALKDAVHKYRDRVALLSGLLQRFQFLQHSLAETDTVLASIPTLDLTPAESSSLSFDFLARSCLAYDSLSVGIAESGFVLDSIRALPEGFPVDLEAYRSLRVFSSRIAPFQAPILEVPELTIDCPDPSEWETLSRYRLQLTPMVAGYKKTLADLVPLEAELKEISGELGSISTCPTCGQPHEDEAHL